MNERKGKKSSQNTLPSIFDTTALFHQVPKNIFRPTGRVELKCQFYMEKKFLKAGQHAGPLLASTSVGQLLENLRTLTNLISFSGLPLGKLKVKFVYLSNHKGMKKLLNLTKATKNKCKTLN
ncbi:CLUMA_CG003001, isoform A [Clunio marinus]|uniref:CLUMA_CG003001, isoform A n=1 Tax=Clunio marinus TaxID=568069 RepID=A0A1J1HNY2_9DIPT|nr:CLUMA_CG003001, isoform A [Clunio marinus]